MSQLSTAAAQHSHCVRERECVCVCVCVRERVREGDWEAQRPRFNMYVHRNCENHSEVIVNCNLGRLSSLLCFLKHLGGEACAAKLVMCRKRKKYLFSLPLTVSGRGSDGRVWGEAGSEKNVFGGFVHMADARPRKALMVTLMDSTVHTMSSSSPLAPNG